MSDDKNDVVILKNHESYPEDKDEDDSRDQDSDWDFEDDLRA